MSGCGAFVRRDAQLVPCPEPLLPGSAFCEKHQQLSAKEIAENLVFVENKPEYAESRRKNEILCRLNAGCEEQRLEIIRKRLELSHLEKEKDDLDEYVNRLQTKAEQLEDLEESRVKTNERIEEIKRLVANRDQLQKENELLRSERDRDARLIAKLGQMQEDISKKMTQERDAHRKNMEKLQDGYAESVGQGGVIVSRREAELQRRLDLQEKLIVKAKKQLENFTRQRQQTNVSAKVIQELRKKVKDSEEHRRRLVREIDNSTGDYATALAELEAGIAKEREDMQTDRSTFFSQQREHFVKMQEAQEKLHFLHRQLDEAKSQTREDKKYYEEQQEKLESEVAQLKSQLINAQEHVLTQKRDSEIRVKDAELRASTLLQKMKNKLHLEFKSKQDALAKEREIFRERFQMSMQELETKDREIERNQSNLNREESALRKKQDELDSDLATMRLEREEHRLKVTELESNLADLEQRKKDMENERLQKKQEIEHLKDQYQRRLLERKRKENEIKQEMRNIITERNQQAILLQKANRALNESRQREMKRTHFTNNLVREMKALKKETASLRQKQILDQASLEKYKTKCARIIDKYSQVHDHTVTMKEQHSRWLQDLKDKEREVETLQQQLIRERQDSRKEELKQCEELRQGMKQEIAAQKKQLDQLVQSEQDQIKRMTSLSQKYMDLYQTQKEESQRKMDLLAQESTVRT